MWIMIGIVTAVYALLVFYVGWSGWRWMKPDTSRILKAAYVIVLTFVAASFILGQFFENNTLLTIVGSYWMAIFYVLLLLLPITHAVMLLLRFTKLSRDQVQRWAGVAVLLVLVGAIGAGSFNAYSPVVRTYHIHIPKLSDPSKPLTIAMAADMHFGVLSNKHHAAKLVEEINKLNPDLVLFAGDLVDDDIVEFTRQGIDRILSGIQAPLGVYAALGNHDRHDGPPEELVDALEKSGMRVLYDEAVEIDGQFTLAGRRDDSDPGRAPLEELLTGVDPSKPVFLIDHQPTELGIAQQQGVDLIVSGHTHHGQVFPGSLLTGLLFENDWGYLQKEQLHSIVTSGYGFWGPPIRIGTRSEIVQIIVN